MPVRQACVHNDPHLPRGFHTCLVSPRLFSLSRVWAFLFPWDLGEGSQTPPLRAPCCRPSVHPAPQACGPRVGFPRPALRALLPPREAQSSLRREAHCVLCQHPPLLRHWGKGGRPEQKSLGGRKENVKSRD